MAFLRHLILYGFVYVIDYNVIPENARHEIMVFMEYIAIPSFSISEYPLNVFRRLFKLIYGYVSSEVYCSSGSLKYLVL